MDQALRFLVPLLLFALPCPAQQILPQIMQTAPVSGTCPFTDSFSGSGPLSANWTFPTGSPFAPNYPNGSLVQASGVAEQNNAFNAGAELITSGGCTFTEDQYIYAKATSWSNGALLGLWVLTAGYTGGGTGYNLQCTQGGGQCTLARYAGSTRTSLSTTCGTLVQGDYLGLAVTGTGGSQAINVYISTTTTFGAATCSVTDNTYTSGPPGILIDNVNSPVTNTQFGPVTAGNGAI